MKRKKRIPYIAQLGRTDCGIACLTMIFNYYGFKADIVDIGNMACIGRDGMTLAQMKDIAEKYGFKFKRSFLGGIKKGGITKINSL